MIEKLKVVNPRNTPIGYLPKLKAFSRGKTYEFKKGVNVIVGENGSGKTTLMNLLKSYLMVDEKECGRGMFNSTFTKIIGGNDRIKDGVEVWADYKKNTFRLCHKGERSGEKSMEKGKDFATFVEIQKSSQGESVMISLSDLFSYMFSPEARLYYPYEEIYNKEWEKPYLEYVRNHKVEDKDNYWTILMDEPDRNLDIKNVDEIRGILSIDKPNTQIITVLHNPLLIYSLSKCDHINFIEMTKGYKDMIIKEVEKIIK